MAHRMNYLAYHRVQLIQTTRSAQLFGRRLSKKAMVCYPTCPKQSEFYPIEIDYAGPGPRL